MSNEIATALDQLAAGRVVAAATESFFGLLADIGTPLAVEALFALKPRGADKGVPTILPSQAAWLALVAGAIPSLALAFADALWPGGLNIALPAAPSVATRVALDSPGGAPSTVVRVDQGNYAVARVGAVSPSALEEIAKRFQA